VTHYTNSIAGAIRNNKFESSETPTKTGTVSVNCLLPVKRQTMTETEKSSYLGEIYAATMRLGQLPTDCSMRIIIQSL